MCRDGCDLTYRNTQTSHQIKGNFFHSLIFLTNQPFVKNPRNLLANYLEAAAESYGVHSQSTQGNALKNFNTNVRFLNLRKDFQHLFHFFQYFFSFVYIQTMLNWFSAKYKTSKFITKVDNSCMESCEEIEATVTNGANKPAKYTLSGRLGPGGKAGVKLYKFLKRERLSLLWKWCKSCNNFCPPRAHHCKVQATIHFRECQINELTNKTDQSYTYMLKFYLLTGLNCTI